MLAPAASLALVWRDLPTRIPTHWNLQGEIDRWGVKFPEILVLPVTILAVCLVLRALPRIDPKLRRSLGREDRMNTILPLLRVTLLALLNVAFLVQIAVSLGHNIAAGRVLMCATLALFLVLGNYLGNLRPNYFFGLRTPWTLENHETWRATHRLGGKVLVFGALLLLGLQFFCNAQAFGWIFGCSIIALAAWAFLYSWHHARTHAVPR